VQASGVEDRVAALAMCFGISAAPRFASRRQIASTIRGGGTCPNARSPPARTCERWKTSGMSTVRASIDRQPVVAGGGEDAVVEPAVRPRAAWRTPSTVVDVDAHGGRRRTRRRRRRGSPELVLGARSVATSTA
jgi:hypothetical protein